MLSLTAPGDDVPEGDNSDVLPEAQGGSPVYRVLHVHDRLHLVLAGGQDVLEPEHGAMKLGEELVDGNDHLDDVNDDDDNDNDDNGLLGEELVAGDDELRLCLLQPVDDRLLPQVGVESHHWQTLPETRLKIGKGQLTPKGI